MVSGNVGWLVAMWGGCWWQCGVVSGNLGGGGG